MTPSLPEVSILNGIYWAEVDESKRATTLNLIIDLTEDLVSISLFYTLF